MVFIPVSCAWVLTRLGMAQALRNPSRQRLPSANNLGAIDLSGITELQAVTKKGAFAPFLYRGAESRQRIQI